MKASIVFELTPSACWLTNQQHCRLFNAGSRACKSQLIRFASCCALPLKLSIATVLSNNPTLTKPSLKLRISGRMINNVPIWRVQVGVMPCLEKLEA